MIARCALIVIICVLPSIGAANEYDTQQDSREPKPVYSVFRWPQDLVSVPCSAWNKDNLGAWALTGTLNWTGGDARVWGPTYQPTTPEGMIVEQKCAATK
jgi:hypothetical protein